MSIRVRIRAQALAAVCACALAGCAIYPARDTYFEASSSVGEPASYACRSLTRHEYMRYERPTGELLLGGRYWDSGAIVVTGSLRLASLNASFDGTRVRVVPASGGSARQARYAPPRQARYAPPLKVGGRPQLFGRLRYDGSFAASFPATAAEGRDFQVVFEPGALVVAGQDYPLAPVRFQEVTRWAIDYGSINC